jgi:ABC-type bacteriocin/lantibiotic exporter with double-glycine peptidase domain
MRRRRGVKVIAQRSNWDCGVASLAMILGVPYGDVSAASRARFGKPPRRGLGIYHLEELASLLGFSLRRVYRREDYLLGQSGVLGMNGGAMCWAGHWVVLKGGAILDPDGAEVWTVDDYTAKHKCRPATLLVVSED